MMIDARRFQNPPAAAASPLSHRLRSRVAQLLACGCAAACLLAPRPAAAASAPLAASGSPPAVGGGLPPPAPPAPPGITALQADPLPIIGIDEVKVGQRGYGLSVFAGRQPERFDVEVIGVMRNYSPDTSYILARLSGRGLESSGVAAGMSGSPVFLDGRLAGAVSFGWPFSKEAICGITPIAEMRRLTTLGGPLPTMPQPPVQLSDLLAGRVPPDLLAHQLTRLQAGRLPGVPEGATAGVEWSASGFGELSRGVLRQALGSVAPMGKAAAAPAGAAPPDLVPGSAVAVVLVSGDLQLAATGTVTDHLGDRILAFGHPFIGAGAISAPMAAAEVVTVLSSQYTSFKIANLGQTVGAFEQDRQMGIEGRLGARATTIPMVLRVRGPLVPVPPGTPGIAAAPAASGARAHAAAMPAASGGPAAMGGARQFHVEIADQPELLPTLAGTTLLGGLESASYSAGPQSLEMTAHFDLAGYGELVMRQSFDGDNAATAMAGHLFAIVAYLMQNPLQRVRIQSIQVDVEQAPQPLSLTLLAAHADRTVVHPGDRALINLELQAYRGERLRRAVELRLPRDLPTGRYSLLVGDGASVDGARLQLAPIEPQTFSQALALLRSLHSRRDLAVLGFYGGAGLSVGGELMPRLPGSVRSIWGAADSAGGIVALRSAIVQERHEALNVPLDGLLRLDLEVRRRDQPGDPGDADGAGDRSGPSDPADPATPAAPAVPEAPVDNSGAGEPAIGAAGGGR